MNKFLAGTALAVVALSATPAAAQAVMGPRVEIHAGADIERVKIDRPDTDGITTKVNDTGILYGLGIGYDFAVTNTVSVGVEASIDRSRAELEKTYLHIFPDDFDDATLEVSAKPRYIGFVGGRVSFAVSDTSNFYVNGGYTRVGYRAKARITDNITGISTSERDSDRVGGYRVGAGAQVNFGTNTYVGAEVNYSDLKDDFSRIGVQFALGLRFGARPVEVIEAAPPAPAPMPEPAPATQTCADGSVILATDICPAPPAPPMPEPTPERG